MTLYNNDDIKPMNIYIYIIYIYWISAGYFSAPALQRHG